MPIADIKIENNKSIFQVGDVIKLTSFSKDPDKRPKSIENKWLILEKPRGSQTSISKRGAFTAYFIPDLPGRYKIVLLANDGLDIAQKTINLDIMPTQQTQPKFSSLIPSQPAKDFTLICKNTDIGCKIQMFPNEQRNILIIPQSISATNNINEKK